MKTPLRIFHVDDSEFDRELVRDVLEVEEGQFTVITAASREEFEIHLATGNYDLVLTDFNILGFEGLQVIDAVHAVLPSIPVIVLTGTGSEEVAVEAMKRGAADYVIKTPRHIRRLPVAIEHALEHKQLQEQRVRSERALRSSEARLRAFANALPDQVFIMDKDGRYVHNLSASEHLLADEAEVCLGKLVSDVLPEPAATKIKAAIRQAIETSVTQSVEYQLELNTELKWFEGRFSRMTDIPDEKKLVVFVARDITDRKDAEIKLTRERNLLRTLIDNVPDYIFATDMSGRLIASNNAHAAAANLSPPQIIGQLPSEVFSSEMTQQFHSDDTDLMLSGQTLINEERLVVDAYQNHHWVLMTKVPLNNDSGDVTGLVGIARDITYRKRAEKALQESEEYLQAIIACTPVILFVLDLQGRLMLLQGQGLNVFGDSPDSLIGQSILETFGNFIPDIRERFQQALWGEETGSIQTIGNVMLDVRYSPLRDKAGEINGIIGVATDITERLKAERLRIELEKEQEIIALKERFIAMASHDFRTPLSIIKMNASMLEKYFEQIPQEQRTAKLQQIERHVDQMTRLLNNVLTLSKANAGKIDFEPIPVELRPFCEQIWDSFLRVAEKTHKIDFFYACDQQVVMIDPNLVHYILANLLSNAIKYSPMNGYIRFVVLSDTENVIFRVIDNGIGIPKQDQSQLFEPFYRAANSGGIDGTGLGLSIVKSYVEIHHGSIEYESEENRGTTFTVYIPLKPVR